MESNNTDEVDFGFKEIGLFFIIVSMAGIAFLAITEYLL